MNLEKGAHKFGLVKSGRKDKDVVSEMQTKTTGASSHWSKWPSFKSLPKIEQDGGGVGGHGVHLSPQTHQKYTFRHRSACRTPAESREEYLTSGKEYIDLHKTRDQALSLWSGSTDSKTLDYQRTPHPREY